MSSSTTAPDRFPTAAAVEVQGERLRVTLVDGQGAHRAGHLVGIGWPATDAQRSDHEIIEGGQGIWWDQLDDGLSVPRALRTATSDAASSEPLQDGRRPDDDQVLPRP